MDPLSVWRMIASRHRRKLIPLDVEHCSPLALRQILLNVRTPAYILDRIAHAFCDDEDILRDLVRCPNLSEEALAFIALAASEEIKQFITGTRVMDLVVMDDALVTTGGPVAGHGKAKPEEGKKKLNLTQQVQKMSVPKKIRLAMMGGKEARGLLIRESNKQVSTAVLNNARITEGEIEAFAQSKNMGEDILRIIGNNSEWCKKQSIATALVNNAKTPVGIAVPFVNRMNDKDLAMLEKSKNVSEAVRAAARGLLTKRKKKSGG
ncbi:MAG: hypothetical protein A2X56_11120 [Nitrospirae bacterium GWC2_57_13]|jgi:hypothetical protein|nr:MAG: hypothetical protein A2X56_11120 [Nitrospirae bacterium GWC2_57_13]OGW41664.1 MAG: hypothetical protein A2X57_03005 [Nitrospirae bacterium GWD2_57_8]HAS53725.1 hypothetical protein [Nitrospiraceae bacterium]